MLHILLTLLLLNSLVAAHKDSKRRILPVVLWHACGSNCCDGFTKEFMSMITKELPTAHIVSIRVGNNPSEDEHRSYFDNADRQINEVCNKLKRDPSLSNGFNAIGLSQGGLMMRALIEKCVGLNVENLITFGSPHQGVSAFPGCAQNKGWAKWSPTRWLGGWFKKMKQSLIPCTVMNGLIGTGIYSSHAQNQVLPAQYFKDPNKMARYYQSNRFLVDINNEGPTKNKQHKEHLTRLKKFIMFYFEKEEIVYPPESTNFGYYGRNGKSIMPLRELPIYKEDWIGLKQLDQRGSLLQIKLPGEHLNINQDVIRHLVTYLVS